MILSHEKTSRKLGDVPSPRPGSPVVQVACPFRLWPAPDSGDRFRKTEKSGTPDDFMGKIW